MERWGLTLVTFFVMDRQFAANRANQEDYYVSLNSMASLICPITYRIFFLDWKSGKLFVRCHSKTQNHIPVLGEGCFLHSKNKMHDVTAQNAT